MWNKDTAERALRKAGIEYYKEEPLKKHISFQVGGPAAFFCLLDSIEKVRAVLQTAKTQEIPLCLLGKGSNLVFRDEGYAGIILHLAGSGFSEIKPAENGLYAGADVSLSALCVASQQQGFSGLEFAYGIPGGVGGGVYMNAGAYGGEMVNVLESVTYLNENHEVVVRSARDLDFGYRASAFQENPWVILGASFGLTQDDPAQILARMEKNRKKRTEKQPLELPSAGSAFKRPVGAFAGALIDQCGLRGFQVGGAAISEKHCGFIVNLGGATCRDILQLADAVSRTVEAKTGFRLEKEIRVVDESTNCL